MGRKRSAAGIRDVKLGIGLMAPAAVTVRMKQWEMVEVRRSARRRGFGRVSGYMRGLCQADMVLQEAERDGERR
jgi:hypothetical protein